MDTATNTTAACGPVIRLASRTELGEVLRIQHAAFLRVAKMFDIPFDRLHALTETVGDLERLMDEGFVFLLADLDARPVGTVRAELRGDGVVEIGRLAVDDGYEGRGVAKALMRAVEDVWPAAARLELFTGAAATIPLALYASLGYEPFDKPGEIRESLVWLAKRRR